MIGNNRARKALHCVRRFAIHCAVSALCSPMAFAQPTAALPPPCVASATSTASISWASTPAIVVMKPSRQGQRVAATGYFYVKNDGSVALSRWCAVAYLSDYADVPQKTTIGLAGAPPSDNVACRDWLVQPGEIRDLALTLEVDANRLPESGLVVVAANGQSQTKSQSEDTSTVSKNKAKSPQRRNKREGTVSAALKAAPCTVHAKQVSQAVVVSLVNSATNACWMVFLTGLLAMIFLLVCLAVFRSKLREPMGASQWSFSSSAATNLTVVGGLLATALASSALPDFPHYMTKQSYLVLSLLFGVLASLSPVLYNFCCKPVGPSQANPEILDFQGWVWLFLSADALTLWAVSGQLGTLCLLFNEFAARQHIGNVTTWVSWVVAGAIVMALFFYCGRTVRFYVSHHPARVHAEGFAAEAPAPRWTAL